MMGLPLRLGVFADCTDRSMPIVDLAVALEERGFGGIFLNEHPHLPVDHPRSTFPPGGDIPDRYARFWDPYIALAFVAARTGLEIGTCISLVAEHDAIALAKAVATLDVLSGGRLLLGVGFGWHREEFEDHGRPASVRAQVVEETVLLMKALWTDEIASFDGDFLKLSRSRSWPKPVQRPHPPILLGAPSTGRNHRRVAAWGDGFIPMGAPLFDGDVVDRQLADLRSKWVAAGRDPHPCRITLILGGVRVADLPRAVERAMVLDVERVLVHLPEAGTDDTLLRLDRVTAQISSYLDSQERP
jgi:probable F420-dependent oxidoreductase